MKSKKIPPKSVQSLANAYWIVRKKLKAKDFADLIFVIYFNGYHDGIQKQHKTSLFYIKSLRKSRG